ncbi:hypothetical protein Tco_1014064 [Tanacetum coccineum]
MPVLEDQPAQVILDPHAEAISVSSSNEEVEPLTSNLVCGSRFSILDDDTLTSITGRQFSRLHHFCPSQVCFKNNEGRGPVRLFARGGNWTRGTLIDISPKTTFAAPTTASTCGRYVPKFRRSGPVEPAAPPPAARSDKWCTGKPDDRGAGDAFASLQRRSFSTRRTPIDSPPKPTSELPGFATPAAAAAGINLREATLQPSTRAPAQFLKIDAELRNDITGIKVLSGTCEFHVPREGHCSIGHVTGGNCSLKPRVRIPAPPVPPGFDSPRIRTQPTPGSSANPQN